MRLVVNRGNNMTYIEKCAAILSKLANAFHRFAVGVAVLTSTTIVIYLFLYPETTISPFEPPTIAAHSTER